MLFPALVGEKSQRFVRPQNSECPVSITEIWPHHAVGGALQTTNRAKWPFSGQAITKGKCARRRLESAGGGQKVSEITSLSQSPVRSRRVQQILRGPDLWIIVRYS